MNEQINQPDESKFKAMEVVAQASGPEAEARRQEMANWAEHVGRHAERAASRINDAARDAVAGGDTAEAVANRISTMAHEQAEQGVMTHKVEELGGMRRTTNPIVKPTAEGVQVRSSDVKDFYRSPAHIKDQV